MIIRKYGLNLHRLREEHLETVRQGRNAPEVRQCMFFQKTITPEMQREWFSRVNNRNNYYFVVEYRGSFIGMVNGKDADFEKGSVTLGIFFWDSRYRKTHVPMMASVLGLEFVFGIMGMNRALAHAQKENPALAQYIENLGYRLLARDPENGRTVFSADREVYYRKARRLRSLVMRLARDARPLSWDDLDFSQVTPLERTRLYSGLPQNIQDHLDQKLNSHPSQPSATRAGRG